MNMKKLFFILFLISSCSISRQNQNPFGGQDRSEGSGSGSWSPRKEKRKVVPAPPRPDTVQYVFGVEEDSKISRVEPNRSPSSFGNTYEIDPGPNQVSVTSHSTLNRTNGKISYHIPDTMKVGLPSRIKVRITKGHLISNVELQITPNSPIINIKTSETMSVEIVDPESSTNKAFDVVKTNSEVQLVDSTEFTEWLFDLTPVRSGKFSVNIVVSIINGDNKKEKVYNGVVWVQSNPTFTLSQIWKEHWQWFFTTLIIPIFVWWWKNRKNKKSPE